MVPQARFELAEARRLEPFGVPISIATGGDPENEMAEGGRFERPNVAVKARCRRPLGEPPKNGIPRRHRTLNLWFWRPVLCQLSYRDTENWSRMPDSNRACVA